MEFTVRVPGSMSNLGSGFDTFGLAISLYSTFKVRLSDNFSIKAFDKTLESENNLFFRVYKKCAEIFKESIKPIDLYIDSEIPLSRGLGSSSTAIVGAIESFCKIYNKNLSIDEKLAIAYEFEPHPDNLVPAMIGKFNICIKDDQKTIIKTLDFPKELKIIALIPNIEISTEKAREVLKKEVSLKDAVFNIARSSLFVSALLTKDFVLLKESVRDKIHQPYRKTFIPGFDELLEKAYAEGALAAFLSGSGSTIGVFTLKDEEKIGRSLLAIFDKNNIKADFKILNVDEKGALII